MLTSMVLCVQMRQIGSDYVARDAPMTGKINLENGNTLDLSDERVRVWASELASVSCAASAIAENHLHVGRRRRSPSLRVASVGSNSAGLSALNTESETDAQLYKNAVKLTLDVVGRMIVSVEKMFSSNVVTEIAFLSSSPSSSSSSSGNYQTVVAAAARRSRKLAEGNDGEDGDLTAEATAYVQKRVTIITGSVLIIAALLAACAICYMPVVQDSLLYPRTKQE